MNCFNGTVYIPGGKPKKIEWRQFLYFILEYKNIKSYIFIQNVKNYAFCKQIIPINNVNLWKSFWNNEQQFEYKS